MGVPRPTLLKPKSWYGVAVASAAVLGVTLAGCSDSSSGKGQAATIHVGVVVSLTGYLAAFDTPLSQGVKLAADSMNASGGIDGHKITLDVVDSQSLPDRAVTEAQKLIDQKHVDALIAGTSSSSTAALAPIAERAEVPLTVASGLPAPQPKWAFSVYPPVTIQVDSRLAYAKSLGYTKIGVLSDDTPFSVANQSYLKSKAKDLGLTVTDLEQFPAATTSDLTSLLQKITATAPQVVIKLGGGTSDVLAAKNLATLGSTVPLSLAVGSLGTFQQAAAAYPKTTFLVSPPQAPSGDIDAGVQASLNAFLKVWNQGHSGQDPAWSAIGWDEVQILAKGVEAAGSTGGAKLRDGVEGVTYAGTSYKYAFSAANHVGATGNSLRVAVWKRGAAAVVSSGS